MKKRACAALFLAVFCLTLFSAAGRGAKAASGPEGTWSDYEITSDGQTFIGIGSCSVTFYGNGTYNGILFQTYPISGQWTMEDQFILTDDATMELEDENTLVIYYGDTVIKCARKPEAPAAAVQLITGCFDRTEALFGGAVKAMEAVRAWISDRQYASLLRARFLCSEVMALTDESAVPENPFDRFKQRELEELGLDAGGMEILPNMCGGAEGDVRQIMSFCLDYLRSGYCHADESGAAFSVTESYDAYFRAIGRMQPALARLAFGPLWDDPAMKSLWESIPERWTVLGAEFPEETDAESLQTLYFGLVDQAAEANGGGGESWNTYAALSEKRAESIAAGDYEALRSGFSLPESVPALFFLPDFMLAAERVRIRPGGDLNGEGLPGEAVLTVLNTDGEEYTDVMRMAAPEGTALRGSAEEGWSCDLTEAGVPVRSAWDPETKTAEFRFDPSRITIESFGVAGIIMNLADSVQ